MPQVEKQESTWSSQSFPQDQGAGVPEKQFEMGRMCSVGRIMGPDSHVQQLSLLHREETARDALAE